MFGTNEYEIRQVGRVDLSTGEYVSAPNLAINTTKEGFGDDTTTTGKNRIWYLPETDELMYSFLAPRYGGYWNVTREQRVGVFRGWEEGPLVNANPGEFEMWMRGINVGIWDAVEKAILVLMEGWPGFEHPTNYYYNGDDY